MQNRVGSNPSGATKMNPNFFYIGMVFGWERDAGDYWKVLDIRGGKVYYQTFSPITWTTSDGIRQDPSNTFSSNLKDYIEYSRDGLDRVLEKI